MFQHSQGLSPFSCRDFFQGNPSSSHWMSLMRELKHLPIPQSFTAVWSCSSNYCITNHPQIESFRTTTFMLPMNLCFQWGLAGRALLCSKQLSCRLASSEHCSLMSLGVGLDCWLEQPTYCFHVSWSSSQYGGRIPRASVPRESQADSVLRSTDQATEVIWHHLFFSAFSLSRQSQRHAQVYRERK